MEKVSKIQNLTCPVAGLTELSKSDMADISPQNDISPLSAEAGDKIVPKHPDIVAEKGTFKSSNSENMSELTGQQKSSAGSFFGPDRAVSGPGSSSCFRIELNWMSIEQHIVDLTN